MAVADRVEDRPKPAHAKSSSRGGVVKVAASGLAGMVFGAIVTVVGAVILVLKSVGKVIRPT